MPDKRLLAYYDLRCAPLSFDFALYLSALIGHATKNEYSKITLCVFAPFFRKSNSIELGYPDGYEDRKVRNVIFSLSGLTSLIDDIIFTKSGLLPRTADSFPLGYDPADPSLASGSALSLMPCTVAALESIYEGRGNPRVFKATRPGIEWVSSRFTSSKPIVTLSLRHTQHNPSRNCSLDDFYSVYRGISERFPRVQTIVIPDQDDLMGSYKAKDFDWLLCPETALDHELRLALYSKAALNISWTGGTTAMLMLSDSNYIVFGLWNETSNVSSKAFFNRKGPRFDTQLQWALPETQIIDWTHAPDVTAAYIFERAAQLLTRILPRHADSKIVSVSESDRQELANR
jgi:hypothetical protein